MPAALTWLSPSQPEALNSKISRRISLTQPVSPLHSGKAALGSMFQTSCMPQTRGKKKQSCKEHMCVFLTGILLVVLGATQAITPNPQGDGLPCRTRIRTTRVTRLLGSCCCWCFEQTWICVALAHRKEKACQSLLVRYQEQNRSL